MNNTALLEILRFLKDRAEEQRDYFYAKHSAMAEFAKEIEDLIKTKEIDNRLDQESLIKLSPQQLSKLSIEAQAYIKGLEKMIFVDEKRTVE